MMATFIANAIIRQAKKSVDLGRNKYKAYFVKTHIYDDWKADVDAILIVEGYEDCIVEI